VDHHLVVHQFARRVRAGLVVAPERAFAADRVELDGGRRKSGGCHLPDLSVHHQQACWLALAVIASRESRHVIGLLSEAHALRRYSEELELRRRELLGE